MREYFCAYHSMLDATRKLSEAECGRLFRALLAYSQGRTELINLQGREEIVFDIYSQQIDREIEKYSAACERNRRNGAGGGQSPRVGASGGQSPQNKDKDKGKGEDKDKDKDESHDDAHARANTLEAYASGNLQTLSPGNMQDLIAYKDELPEDVIRFAIDEACGNGAPRWAYVRAILEGYKRDGVKSVGDAKAAKERKARKARDNPALDYAQRDYKAEEFGDDFFFDAVSAYGGKT